MLHKSKISKKQTFALSDYILSNSFDIVAVTETWLGSSVDKACINELVPCGYQIKHVPHLDSLHGGGVALIYKSSVEVCIVSSTNDKDFSTFEYMDCNVLINDYSLCLAVLYRPPPTREIGLKTSVFLEQEWSMFLTKYTRIDTTSIIVGDLKYSH